MNRWRTFAKYAIALYSESIWIYFAIVLFMKIEQDVFVFPQPLSWLAAAIAAYGLNAWLSRKWSNPLWVYGINLILLAGIVIQNWRTIPDGAWFYGMAVSIAVCYIYLRSMFYVQKGPSREQMLLRFEGNVLFYFIYVLISLAHPLPTPVIHLFFMIAIVLSLLGMVLTLYPETDGDDKVETHLVGEAGWLPVLFGAVFIAVCLASLLLLLPAVQTALTEFVIQAWQGIVWLWEMMWTAVLKLLSLLPSSESEQVLPEQDSSPFEMPEGLPEETQLHLPLFWIFGAVALVAFIALLWFLSKGLRRLKVSPRVTVIRSSVRSVSWWKSLLHWVQKVMGQVTAWIKGTFPGYYALPVYWYFYRLTRWGKRNGIPRQKHETPIQYVRHVAAKLDPQAPLTVKGKQYQWKRDLLHLGEAYAAAYYSKGKHVQARDFKPLFRFLRTVRLQKRSRISLLAAKKGTKLHRS